MDPRQLLGQDERLLGICAYCAAVPDTIDHVPPKVLLDEPYPAQLRTVDSCLPCNNSVSRDELYFACFIECVISGTTEPARLTRSKIARKLREEPLLADEIARSRRDGEPPLWQPDNRRVDRVLRKLAQGHAAWELTLPALGEPTRSSAVPLVCMSDSQRAVFEMPPSATLWPELGSRAFYRAVKGGDSGWQIVQTGRYRYCVDQDAGLQVRIVVSEYLAAMVLWE